MPFMPIHRVCRTAATPQLASLTVHVPSQEDVLAGAEFFTKVLGFPMAWRASTNVQHSTAGVYLPGDEPIVLELAKRPSVLGSFGQFFGNQVGR